jgi:hypothetical protein
MGLGIFRVSVLPTDATFSHFTLPCSTGTPANSRSILRGPSLFTLQRTVKFVESPNSHCIEA